MALRSCRAGWRISYVQTAEIEEIYMDSGRNFVACKVSPTCCSGFTMAEELIFDVVDVVVAAAG
jgi:hypothetical protein